MDAMVAFRKSLELDSAQPDALVNLANLYAAQGNQREAIKVGSIA
jgi:Flp pilus assembly protein TadD